MIKYVPIPIKYTLKKDHKRTYLMMIMRFFSDFLYKGICCGYSFELHRQVDAIQMRTHNICLYKKVNKKYTGCNKTTEFHECALIGVCAVIRSNTVTSYRFLHNDGKLVHVSRYIPWIFCHASKKGKRKVQGVPQS